MWWPFRQREKKTKEHRSQAEYRDYINRKQKERAKSETAVVEELPVVDEIKKRPAIPAQPAIQALPVKEEKIFKPRWIKTGVPGFDELLTKGIPKGVSNLVAGGPGSGKTIFCLQTLYYGALNGEKCLYVSFEESVERLKEHMKDFGWNLKDIKGSLRIMRVDPFKISRAVEAMLAKAKGELLIDIEEIPEIFEEDFRPDRIVLDSLSALGAAFYGIEGGYRVYIEQLFKFFEKLGVTSFLISETDQVPTVYSRTGIEEFLADGVIVFYNVKHGNARVRACEVLKMRGVKHEKKIVPFEVGDNGIVVFPNEPVFMEEGIKA